MRCVLLIAIFIALYSCSTNSNIVGIDRENLAADSTEYVLIVDEINFDSWMITNSKRIWFHSHEYYQAWNKIYVAKFNSHVLNGAQRPFTELINYDYSINYGIELDYKLYWYFIFIQEKYDVSLYATRY